MSFENAIVLGMIDALVICLRRALTPTPLPKGEGIFTLLPLGEGWG